jgi:multiple sugar transport system substrate-binding protein
MKEKVMKKKLYSTFVLTLTSVLALTLAGCSGKSGKNAAVPEEKVTLTYTGVVDNSGTIQKIIEAVEANFPNVKIDLQEVPGNSDDMKKSLITSLAAGQDDPDLFNMDVIWTTQFAAAGWLTDLSDKLDRSEYLDGPLSTVTYNNKLWAVPMYTDVQVLYYRTDLLSAPPKSWDELVALSKEHQASGAVEWGFLWQGFQGEPIVCNALTFIKSNGGNDIVAGKPVINSLQSKEALQFMRSLIDGGISSEGVLAQKPADQVPVFQEGKALFMISWPGNYMTLQNAEGSKVKDKFSVTEFPTGPKGTTSAPTVGGWNIAVNAYSNQQALAIEVAKYMCGETVSTIRSLGQSTLPTNKAVYNNTELAEKNPVVALCKNSIQYAASRPNAPDYPAMSQLLAVNFNKALSKTMSYDECLDTIEKEMVKLINN